MLCNAHCIEQWQFCSHFFSSFFPRLNFANLNSSSGHLHNWLQTCSKDFALLQSFSTVCLCRLLPSQCCTGLEETNPVMLYLSHANCVPFLFPSPLPLSFSLFYLLHSSHTSHCSPVTHTTIKRLPTHGSQLTYHTILNPLPTHSLSHLLTPLYFRLEFHLIFATDADATFKRKLINLRENKLLVKIIKPCCTMYSTLKFLILTNKTNINLTK